MEQDQSPDMATIVNSEVWNEHIVPWLKQMLDDKHFEAETYKTVEDLWQSQGFCQALRAVLMFPAFILEQSRKEHDGTDGRTADDVAGGRRGFWRRIRPGGRAV